MIKGNDNIHEALEKIAAAALSRATAIYHAAGNRAARQMERGPGVAREAAAGNLAQAERMTDLAKVLKNRAAGRKVPERGPALRREKAAEDKVTNTAKHRESLRTLQKYVKAGEKDVGVQGGQRNLVNNTLDPTPNTTQFLSQTPALYRPPRG